MTQEQFNVLKDAISVNFAGQNTLLFKCTLEDGHCVLEVSSDPHGIAERIASYDNIVSIENDRDNSIVWKPQYIKYCHATSNDPNLLQLRQVLVNQIKYCSGNLVYIHVQLPDSRTVSFEYDYEHIDDTIANIREHCQSGDYGLIVFCYGLAIYKNYSPVCPINKPIDNDETDEIECVHCGCVIDREDAIELDDELYCSDCVATCEHCGAVTLCDDMQEVRLSRSYRSYNAEWWCDVCVSSNATTCDDCGAVCADSFVTEVRDGNLVCGECISRNYYHCSECDEYVMCDDWDDDYEVCRDCANDNHLITQYHNAPPLKWFGKCKPAWNGVMRGIGIELEVDDGDCPKDCAKAVKDILGDEVYFEHDGSLNEYGFEIITQPHTIEAFWQMPWAKVLKTIIRNGYVSHNAGTCGLHVHLSRELFGADLETQDRAIGKLIKFYDDWYEDILKVARRTYDQADQWARSYSTRNIEDAKQFGKKRDAGRYFAVNNTNRRTVEIRIMRGTLNIDSFKACIDFVIRTALNSKVVAWNGVGDIHTWLKGLKPETIEYINRRGAFVNALPNLDIHNSDTANDYNDTREYM